jgi:light-regulated signal transduction histidine kinase (bacteriophytochrome)
MIYDVMKTEFNTLRDPLMIISSTLEVMTEQYTGLMDEAILGHLDRIERARQRIDKIISEMQHPDKRCPLSTPSSRKTT